MPKISAQTAYLLAISSWFIPFAIQGVLFPWLVTIVLQGSGTELGLVQASLTIPLILLPLTGTFAERSDRHSLLALCHLVAAIPALLLAFILYTEMLQYWMLVACGLAYGITTAVALPSRDAMLSEIAGTNLQRMVAITTGTQFGVQIFGFLLAGQVSWLGAVPIVLFQAFLLLLGGLVAQLYLPANKKIQRHEVTPIKSALERLRSTPVPAAMAVNFIVGFFYISAYMVVVPLLLRDRFDGDAGSIAAILVIFTLGIIVSSVFIVRTLNIVHMGRALIIGPMTGAVVLGTFIWVDNFNLMVGLMFLWGMGAGVTISAGRTLVQQNAPADARARVLALHQLTFLGSAPVGSLCAGWAVDQFGVPQTLMWSVGVIALFLLYLRLFSRLWHLPPQTAS